MPLRIRQEVQKVLWPQLSQGTEPDAYSSIVIWMAVSQGMSRMISALDRHGRPRSSSCGRSSIGTSFNLGRVDGFDDDEAQSECDEGSEVPVRFLATERNALEALELADEVFDAGAGAIERLREERWSVPGG